METSEECHPRCILSLFLHIHYFLVLLARLEARDDRSTRIFFWLDFFLLFVARFFLFPFPIVFRNRNFFILFLCLLMSAYLGVNMSETRLNLLFLVVLLPRLKADWLWIEHCFLFWLYFFYIFQENLLFFFRCFHFFSFPFLFLTVFLFLIWMLLSSLSLLFSLWVTWRSA